MNTDYQYQLDKSSKKYLCPECQKRRFVRYVDTHTGKVLPYPYGRCDREAKCSFYCNPYTDGYAKMIQQQTEGYNTTDWKPKPYQRVPKKVVPTYFIPPSILEQTQNHDYYTLNTFIRNLVLNVPYPFDIDELEQVVSLYKLGTIGKGYRKGAVTFPFIDKLHQIRTIQVKQFDNDNHTTGTDFLHSILQKYYTTSGQTIPTWLANYLTNDKKVSCLFGEHLLNDYPLNPVALVEAPKTAVYGTYYFGMPSNTKKLLWLATYNLSSLNLERCQVLQGRDIILFPDLSENGSTFEKWQTKAAAIQKQLPNTRILVSDLLEQNASISERQKGLDLADYLIRQDWKEYRIF
jgi:hypothetical protein